MSFANLLKHRFRVERLQSTFVDGVPQVDWLPVEGLENVRGFLDLGFIRKGKDPIWTPEAGRPSDRSGVLFSEPKPLASGDKIVMLRGPKGTFQIEGAVDEAWTPRRVHHLECGVVEVARQIAHSREP